MTLSGIKLFKFLPGGLKTEKANCKECGFPTCMAFAMKLAKQEVSLDKCKYATDELKSIMNSQDNKTQKTVFIGAKDNLIPIGGENVLYRHEKTFINPTTIGIKIKTSQSISEIIQKIEQIANYTFERVGEKLQINCIAIENNTNAEDFKNLLDSLTEAKYFQRFAFILESRSVEDLTYAASKLTEYHTPLLYLVTDKTDQIINLAKNTNCPVVIPFNSEENLIENLNKLTDAKVDQFIINVNTESLFKQLEIQSLLRRSFTCNADIPVNFPIISFIKDDNSNNDIIKEALIASNLICKYSNIVIINDFDPAVIYSLFTLRQNIFTDPQKPLQIESKLYEVGDVTKDSPILVTTNFALTYFIVSGEIEASNIGCYLLITSSDGMSVLTAWAANKFNGEIIAKAVKEFDLANLVNHRKLIIPGLVSIIKEEVEEELPDWEVIIAPNEAIEIPEFLNNYFKHS